MGDPVVSGAQTRTPAAPTVAVLQEACDRNVPVELHYLNPAGSRQGLAPDILHAQARLLAIDDEHVYLDSPQDIGKHVQIGRGRQVDAYFVFQGKIYKFRSTVTKVQCLVELNRKKRIVGMSLAAPRKVAEGQRREDHRVSLASQDPIKVSLHEAPQDDPDSCPITARRFKGLAVNLSRGGISVRVDGNDRHRFVVGRYFYVSFRLPEDAEEMIFLAEARHSVEILRGAAGRVGFQFLRWPNQIEMRQKTKRLGQYLNEVERSSLRKNRRR